MRMHTTRYSYKLCPSWTISEWQVLGFLSKSIICCITFTHHVTILPKNVTKVSYEI